MRLSIPALIISLFPLALSAQINSYIYELDDCFHRYAKMQKVGNKELLVVGNCQHYNTVALIDSNMQEKWAIRLNGNNQFIGNKVKPAFIVESQVDSSYVIGLNNVDDIYTDIEKITFTLLVINLNGEILNQKTYDSQQNLFLTDLLFDGTDTYYASVFNFESSGIVNFDTELNIRSSTGFRLEDQKMNITKLLMGDRSEVVSVGNIEDETNLTSSIFIATIDSLNELTPKIKFDNIPHNTYPGLYYNANYGYYLSYSNTEIEEFGIINLNNNFDPIASIQSNFHANWVGPINEDGLQFLADTSMIYLKGLSIIDVHPNLNKINKFLSGDLELFLQATEPENDTFQIITILGGIPARSSSDDPNYSIHNITNNFVDDFCLRQSNSTIDTDSISLEIGKIDFESTHLVFDIVSDSITVDSIKYNVQNKCFEAPNNVVDNYHPDIISQFPNPASVEINLRSESELFNNYVVYNSIGEIILLEDFNPTREHKLNCSSWPNGIYFFSIKIDGRNIVKKHIISHR